MASRLAFMSRKVGRGQGATGEKRDAEEWWCWWVWEGRVGIGGIDECAAHTVSRKAGPSSICEWEGVSCSAEHDSVYGEKTILMRVYVPVAWLRTKLAYVSEWLNQVILTSVYGEKTEALRLRRGYLYTVLYRNECMLLVGKYGDCPELWLMLKERVAHNIPAWQVCHTVSHSGCSSNTPPQSKRCKPIVIEKRSCFLRTSPLVKMSAVCSSVGMYSRWISSPSTFCLKKWCWISMCFVLSWNRVVCDGDGGLLLTWSVVGESRSRPRSVRSRLNQMTSFVVCAAAVYLASVLERATEVCFFEDQLTAAPPSCQAWRWSPTWTCNHSHCWPNWRQQTHAVWGCQVSHVGRWGTYHSWLWGIGMRGQAHAGVQCRGLQSVALGRPPCMWGQGASPTWGTSARWWRFGTTWRRWHRFQVSWVWLNVHLRELVCW